MAIQTKESLSGFVRSVSELTFTTNGDARLFMSIGQPQFRHEEDGTFTELEATRGELVMFGKSAERAYAKFQSGHNFIAEGETRPYVKDGVEYEQFVASRAGHDNNITNYTLDLPATEREAAGREAPVRGEAARESQAAGTVEAALAERAAQLDPEPPAATTADAGAVQQEALAR